MIKDICDFFDEKKILLLGFGREGRSTYNFIRRMFPDKKLAIADRNDVQPDGLTNVELFVCDDYEKLMQATKVLSEFDCIVKSPGVVINNLPAFGGLNNITSQTNLFLRFYRDQVVGITGTKGKSTISSLTHHVLKEAGKNVLLVGNIGVPVFDRLEDIESGAVIIYELSSHQLEYADCSPHIAVLTNIFEEHLDHYGTFEKYVTAKQNIFKHQGTDDYFICNAANAPAAYELRSKLLSVNSADIQPDTDIKINNLVITYRDTDINLGEVKLPLKGRHNVYNIAISYALVKFFDTTDDQFLRAVETFKPLPHRLEYVTIYKDVIYYNDSISTVCETAIQAINSLEKVGTVILGGMDRGIDYKPLAGFLLESSVDNIILMPDTGLKLDKLLLDESKGTYNGKNVINVKNLEQAVLVASEITPEGTICLFSPAAPSYGFFKDFEERGSMFKKYVNNLGKIL